MDWRANSSSRSRSRSVSAMDWRSGSRSRSRPATSSRLHPIGDDGEDQIPGEFNISDFVSNDVSISDDNTSPIIGLDSLPSDSDPSLSMRNRSVTTGELSDATKKRRAKQMQKAFKEAAHADLFGNPNNQNDAGSVPFFFGGRNTNPRWEMGAAEYYGAPISNLGSVAGIGDYVGHSGNQHPEYGFLPRLVRKTSFDHNVERSRSRGPPTSNRNTTADPTSQAPKFNFSNQLNPNQQMGGQASSGSFVSGRKRPFREDPSPARPPMRMPVSAEERLAVGLSRNIPSFITMNNQPPSSAFNFTMPGEKQSVNSSIAAIPEDLFDGLSTQGVSDTSPSASGSVPVNSPVDVTGLNNSVSSNGNNVNSSAAPDLQAIMNMFYNSDATMQTQDSGFTHVNPNHLFANMGSGPMRNGGNGDLPPMSDESSSWTYSPSGSDPAAVTPPPSATNAHHPVSYQPSPLAMDTWQSQVQAQSSQQPQLHHSMSAPNTRRQSITEDSLIQQQLQQQQQQQQNGSMIGNPANSVSYVPARSYGRSSGPQIKPSPPPKKSSSSALSKTSTKSNASSTHMTPSSGNSMAPPPTSATTSGSNTPSNSRKNTMESGSGPSGAATSSSAAVPSSTSKTNGATMDDGSEMICYNCKTTKTPLWRRDVELRPLCE